MFSYGFSLPGRIKVEEEESILMITERMSEIHVCPILMRTVLFVDGFCLEDCDARGDCPIKAGFQVENGNDE